MCISGVPQGSILGPLCFAMYVSPISDVISCHKMRYHQYADDLQLYVAMVPSSFGDLSSVIVNCVSDVSRWFLENALLLNPNKTEAVVFGIRQRLQQIDRSHGINLAGSTVQYSRGCKVTWRHSGFHAVIRPAHHRNFAELLFPHPRPQTHTAAVDIGRCKVDRGLSYWCQTGLLQQFVVWHNAEQHRQTAETTEFSGPCRVSSALVDQCNRAQKVSPLAAD